jgi:hypothetical protein
MKAERASDERNLRGLKNISWLSALQLNRLAVAFATNAFKERE